MHILRKTIRLLLLVFFAQHAQANPIKGINSGGGCDGNYFLLVDVCISNDAFTNYSKDELMQLIFEYKGLNTPNSAISSRRTNRQICESKVSENENDYFELRDGSV